MSQAVGDKIMGFINSDFGASELKNQSTEVSKAVKITIMSLSIIVISFTIDRIICDILDVVLTSVTTYATLKTALNSIPPPQTTKDIDLGSKRASKKNKRVEQTIALLEQSLEIP